MAASAAPIVAVLVLLGGLHACSIATPAQPALEIGVLGPTTHLDPARGDEPGTAVVAALAFQTLPQASIAIERSRDARVWTFALPAGRTFADGTALDARAVVANFARWRSHRAGVDRFAAFARTLAHAIRDVAATDATHVRITTLRPLPSLAALLDDGHFSIASPAAFSHGDEAFDRAPVGSGTYDVDGSGDDIAFAPARGARAPFASAAIRDVPDPHTSVLALKWADLTAFYDFPPRYLAEARNDHLAVTRDPRSGRWCAFSRGSAATVRSCPPPHSRARPTVSIDETDASRSVVKRAT